jgi:hypothetical protein
MSLKRFRILAFLFLSLSLVGINPSWAGEYLQIVDLGACFHTGDLTKSLNGSNSYFLGLRAEKRKGFLRPEAAAELQFGSGTAYAGSTESSFSLYGGDFVAGFHLFPFMVERFQPFLGVNGVIGWSLLKMTQAPSGSEPNTQALAFGYELTAGIDMRFGSADGNALRVRSSYWSTSGGLAGQSGFVLSGFRISIGLVY